MEINLMKTIVSECGKKLIGNERDFFLRVWNQPTEIYLTRLRAINFINSSKVLDAGSGFGQWTLALSSLNKNVTGIEIDNNKLKISKNIFDKLGILNTQFISGSVENLPFNNESFDKIFAYSVLPCTNYLYALKEFYRVLKTGGELYFNTNGLGWYLHNLIDDHNSAIDFSAKQMAADAIDISMSYFVNGKYDPSKSIITPSNILIPQLIEMGFKLIAHGAEGTITINKNWSPTSFFAKEYYGYESVYEIICTK